MVETEPRPHVSYGPVIEPMDITRRISALSTFTALVLNKV